MTLSQNWWKPLIRLWFTELTPRDWFTRSDEVDQRLRVDFLALHEAVATHPPAAALAAPQEALAAVIALDQLPRNMFRNTPRAFATDPLALNLARVAIEAGHDRHMSVDERTFLYLPFEHSEALPDQERSVGLFTALGNANYLDYAIRHRDIVRRFARFPHRNAILGRASTPDEEEFLKQPGSSF